MLTVDLHATLGATVFDVGFAAPAGVTALFGPSGAGKTSIINAVAGLWTPQTGRIALDHHVWFDSAAGINLPTHRRRIGYVFQDARLFPHMSVARNLRYGGSHDAEKLIDLLGLAPLLHRRPAGLSGGEKQRVALGRALMRDPALVLMDEPLAALDAPRKAEILPYLERLRDAARAPMIYVSHAISEVAQLATHMVLLDKGHVIDQGTLSALLANPAHAHLIGRREAGAILICQVVGHGVHVTQLTSGAGPFTIQGVVSTIGAKLPLRIPARDIILARTKPTGISALNVLPVTITAITPITGGSVAISLRAGSELLWAEITAHSAQTMALQPGDNLFAIIKATAVAG